MFLRSVITCSPMKPGDPVQNHRTSAPWTPPHGNDVEMVKVGEYWHAVRAPADLAERALAALGDETGAVIADYGRMYWLIRAGSAGKWRRVRHVQVLGTNGAETTYVGVPPAAHTTGPRLHWRVPMGPDRYLTDADDLRQALVRAIASEPAEEVTAR